MTPHLKFVAVLVVAQLALADAGVRLWGIQAIGLSGDPTTPPDPYVRVWCGSTFGGATEFHRDTANPTWNAEFFFNNCKRNEQLKLEVWDKDLIYDDHLGNCITSVKSGTYLNIQCNVDTGTLFYSYELK